MASARDVLAGIAEAAPPHLTRAQREQHLAHHAWRALAAPLLYHFIASFRLAWPALSVSAALQPPSDGFSSAARVVLGTQSGGAAAGGDALLIADAAMPDGTYEVEDDAEDVGLRGFRPALAVRQRLRHGGDVNAARPMPQRQELIATQSGAGAVQLFDARRHPACGDPSAGSDSEAPSPARARVLGRSAGAAEGFALAWSSLAAGVLAADDGAGGVRVWDAAATASGGADEPPPVFACRPAGGAAVNDLCWSSDDASLFAVASDAGLFCCDTRAGGRGAALAASGRPLRCVDTHPIDAHRLAVGDERGGIDIFDLRSPAVPLHALRGHEPGCAVARVAWNPHEELGGLLASAAGTVIIWDLQRAGGATAAPRAGKASGAVPDAPPPEVAFVHGGHAGGASDVSWVVGDPAGLALASVSAAAGGEGGGEPLQSNVLHLWRPHLGALG
jgi:hypothetical protein